MPITTIHCPVSGSDVVRVTDFEGNTTRVVCVEYDETLNACRLKDRASREAPLGRLLARAREGTLATHGTRCDFA